jgi:hypothetical protein
MNKSEIKNILIDSLNAESETSGIAEKLEQEGIRFDFSEKFSGKIMGRLFTAAQKVNQQAEFLKYMNLAFYRIALPGIAAIVLLLLSLFIMHGSVSVDSLLGLNDNYDESIICLLTGN